MTTRWIALPTIAIAACLAASFPAKVYAAPAQDAHYDHDRDHDGGGWDAPPSEFRDVQRKGFHDGVEGARKDFDRHRGPNVEDRDEYRHPPVDRSARDDYRDGFRRGYDVAMQHLMGHPGM